MQIVRTFFFLVCFCHAACADNLDEVKKQFNFVSEYFIQSDPRELYKVQAILKVRGLYGGKVDGKWGRKTETAIFNQLDTYVSIGGVSDDWGVRNSAESVRFLNWIVDAGVASANGTDFPD